MNNTWRKHTDVYCKVCDLYKQQSLLHGKLGGEGTLRTFNELRRTHSGIKQGLLQLESMMKDHLLLTH